MHFLLVSTSKSACSACGGNILECRTATDCTHCGITFDGVMVLAATDKPFHATLTHHAPMDHPDVNTQAMTWYRPWNARLDYEVQPA